MANRNKQAQGADASPMLSQYWRIRQEHRGEVLFFRLGDFYEMFAEDALEVSRLLNLTLTHRNGLPMCGVPYQSARSYIGRLLRLGKKVAICEQVTPAGKPGAKALMEREVVEVVTPGTTVDEYYLDKGSANYLAALFSDGGTVGFAYIDLSTAEFRSTSFPLAEAGEKLRVELERLALREIIAPESLLAENAALGGILRERAGLLVNRWTDWLFDGEQSRKRLCRQFGVESLKGFGLGERSPEVTAAGTILAYLEDTAKSLVPHVRAISRYGESEYVGIDESTLRNLELVHNLRDGEKQFSLLAVMDATKTAMGRRLLRNRLLHPLRDPALIARRLDLVEVFFKDQGSLRALREALGRTPDLERLCARLAMDRAHGKDLLAIRGALDALETIDGIADGALGPAVEGERALFEDKTAAMDAAGFERLYAVRVLLAKAICDEPSILLTEGKLIRRGYDAELDRLHDLRDNGRRLLEDYLEKEKAATGIASLKIRYNRLIGYFFEVTKTNLDRVPSHFIKRQGLAGGERYTTDTLAGLESDINGASDKIIERERTLFLGIREEAKKRLDDFYAAARRLAELDAAASLAAQATQRGWTRPLVNGGRRLLLKEARHPVVEANLNAAEFIPNDVTLDLDGVYFNLITGPNMAGKSTYLRQAALCVIMAQAGSFVPAASAEIGAVDRVYCRVGASDNLARGESTFLVEMNETAYILNTATERSLVIMDEVGRGTGTNDGLAIAQAVSEDILNRIRCRTLFATHYHELAALSHPGLTNRSMQVDEEGGKIIFRRKLREGPASESYGLHVAQLAGLSAAVLERAAAIMQSLTRAAAVPLPASPQPQARPGTPPALRTADPPKERAARRKPDAGPTLFD